MKNKCPLFLPSFSSWRKNYNQHTTPVCLETNKCSEYIEKRIYQVSVFDPTITTIIHEIITDNDQKKKSIKKKKCALLHQMVTRKMKNRQWEHLIGFVNIKGQMNLELTSADDFTEEPIAGKAMKFPQFIMNMILVLIQIKK